jgi:hypothetical protein
MTALDSLGRRLTLAEAREVITAELGWTISYDTVRRWTLQGRFDAVQIVRSWSVTESSLRAFVDAQRAVGVSPARRRGRPPKER